MCIGCASLCHLEGGIYIYARHCAIWKGGIYIYAQRKPCGPNMLDELLKGFIVIPADLHRKGLRD